MKRKEKNAGWKVTFHIMEHSSETLIYRGKTTYRWFAFQVKKRHTREKIITEEIKQIISRDIDACRDEINSVDFHVISQVKRPVLCCFRDVQLARRLTQKLPQLFAVPNASNQLDFEEDIGDDLVYLVDELEHE